MHHPDQNFGPTFSVTSKKGVRQLQMAPLGKTNTSFWSISILSSCLGGEENLTLFRKASPFIIFFTISSFYLKNQCLKIYSECSQPNLSSGLSLSSFLSKSLTVRLICFFQKLIGFPFISIMLLGVVPSKGLAPTSSQQNSRPRQQRSTDLSQPSFLITSGARYSKLPHIVLSFSLSPILQAKPKSQILTLSFRSINIFQGFRSLYTSPFSWRLTIPNAISIQIVYFSARLIFDRSSCFFPLRIIPNKSPKGQYSRMKQTYFRSSNSQQSLILYFDEYCRISNSFFIISREPFSLQSALLILFMQKRCRSQRRYTRNICEQVPSPIFWMISKCLGPMISVWQSIIHSIYNLAISKEKGNCMIRLLLFYCSPSTCASSQYSASPSLSTRSRQQFLGSMVTSEQLSISSQINSYLANSLSISFLVSDLGSAALSMISPLRVFYVLLQGSIKVTMSLSVIVQNVINRIDLIQAQINEFVCIFKKLSGKLTSHFCWQLA